MKKLLLIVAVLLLTNYCVTGQEFYPQVFSSFGGTAQNSALNLTFTIGEPLYETATNSSSILTQGFNQITSKKTAVEDLKGYDFIIAYPNPTFNILNLKVQSGKYTGLDLEVIDVQGRRLLTQTVKSPLEPINLTSFLPGFYFLKILADGKLVKVVKIQKINEI